MGGKSSQAASPPVYEKLGSPGTDLGLNASSFVTNTDGSFTYDGITASSRGKLMRQLVARNATATAAAAAPVAATRARDAAGTSSSGRTSPNR